MIGAPRDHYQVLGVPRTASTEAIRNAYRQGVKRSHPDRDPSPQAAHRFLEIQRAYETLRDPLLKHAYDLRTKRPVPQPAPIRKRSDTVPRDPLEEGRSWMFLALHLTGFLFGVLVVLGVIIAYLFTEQPWYVLLPLVPGLIIIPEAWRGIHRYNTKPRDDDRRAS